MPFSGQGAMSGAASGATAGAAFGPWGAAIGGVGGGLLGGFMGGKNTSKPYDKAAEEMRRAYEEAKAFQKPYNEAGQAQLPILTGAQGRLLDPSSLLSEWMEKYKTSPYAQRSFENARESGLNAASSQGLLGSSAALGNIQQSSSDIMNADRQQFLNDLMQKYMAGIGVGQDIYGRGAEAASQMGKNAMNYGGNIAEMKYGSAQAPRQDMMDMLGLGIKAYGALKPASGGSA